MKAFVTGGAGFIGSNLVRRLLQKGDSVTVFDNLSSGKESNLPKADRVTLVKNDVLNLAALKDAIAGHDIVFHLSSNPDIARGLTETSLDLNQGTIATYNVLESMRTNNVNKIIFPSGSGVYGEVSGRIIAEDYGPLVPISMYGATKLASEAMISCFSHAFSMHGFIFRLGNVVGNRMTHGVIFDFIQKLKRNPATLTVLGDGNQTKPYIHVDDVIDAMFLATERATDRVNIFNVATDDWPTVTWIAQTVIEEMDLKNARIEYTGGDRGWKGDVPIVRLDTTKIKKLGWRYRYDSKQAIRNAIRATLSGI